MQYEEFEKYEQNIEIVKRNIEEKKKQLREGIELQKEFDRRGLASVGLIPANEWLEASIERTQFLLDRHISTLSECKKNAAKQKNGSIFRRIIGIFVHTARNDVRRYYEN